jgi:hypothetical protein
MFKKELLVDANKDVVDQQGLVNPCFSLNGRFAPTAAVPQWSYSAIDRYPPSLNRA